MRRIEPCHTCGRDMLMGSNRDYEPGVLTHGGNGQCRNCVYRTPALVERLTTAGRDSVELDVAKVRASVDALIEDRRARGVPWCGLAPEPRTFKEERLTPGTHRHTTWAEAAA